MSRPAYVRSKRYQNVLFTVTLSLLTVCQSIDAQVDSWSAINDQIRQSKQVLDDSDRSHEERLAAYEQMMKARQQLIEDAAAQTASNQWQVQAPIAVMSVDHALDMFLYEWNRGRAGDTALLGIPTERQRQAALVTAANMYEAAMYSRVVLQRVIADLAQHRDFRANVEMRREHRSLLDFHLGQRAQLMWGIAAIAYAIVEQPPNRQALLEEAVAVLGELWPRLSGDWAEEARLFLARGLITLDRSQESLQVLSQRSEQGIEFGQPQRRFRALVLRSIAQTTLGQTHEARQSATEAAEYAKTDEDRLLLADLLYRIGVVEKGDPSQGYASLRTQAFAVGDVTLAQQALERLMMAQISGTLIRQDPEAMSSVALLARGLRLAKDPTSFEAAESDLIALIARDEVAIQDSAQALELLGRLALAREQMPRGIEFLLKRAQQEPLNKERVRSLCFALESALAYASKQPENATAQSLYRRALRVALQDEGLPDSDRWRIEAARLALNEGRNEDALTYAQAIGSESEAKERAYLLAQAMLAGAVDETFRSEEVDQVIAEAIEQLKDLEEPLNGMGQYRRQIVLANAKRLFALGRSAEALVEINQVQPRDITVLSLTLQCQLDLDEMKEALSTLQLLTQIDLDQAIKLLSQLSKQRDARDLLSEQTPMAPYQRLIEYVYNVATTQKDLALEQRQQLAWLLLQSGRFDQAISLYRELVKRSPKSLATQRIFYA